MHVLQENFVTRIFLVIRLQDLEGLKTVFNFGIMSRMGKLVYLSIQNVI